MFVQRLSCRADDHPDMAGGDWDAVPIGDGLRWGDEVAFGGQVQRWTAKRIAHDFSSHGPFTGSRQVLAEQSLDQFLSGGVGQRLSLVRPFLELDEPPRLRALRIEPTEFGEFCDN